MKVVAGFAICHTTRMQFAVRDGPLDCTKPTKFCGRDEEDNGLF